MLPLYRLGTDGFVRQQFAESGRRAELALPLTVEQRELRGRMVAAHRTQCDAPAHFSLEVERFRPAPAYDFARLPNGGRLLYERYPWGLDGIRWIALASAARAELRLGDSPC